KPILDNIKKVQAVSADLYNYVEELKKTLEEQGGGRNPETGELNKRDDLDVSPRVMINQKKGAELKKKINETREKLLALVDPKDRESVAFSLEAVDPTKPANDGTRKNWEQSSFGDGTPLTAAITILSKIQTDVKNAENAV